MEVPADTLSILLSFSCIADLASAAAVERRLRHPAVEAKKALQNAALASLAQAATTTDEEGETGSEVSWHHLESP